MVNKNVELNAAKYVISQGGGPGERGLRGRSVMEGVGDFQNGLKTCPHMQSFEIRGVQN